MNCYNNCYLPRPPRDWSRVQNSCSLITNIDNQSLVRDPYTKQLVPANVLAKKIAMLNKGNVLQYKANSSNLTKIQRYSKIATGQWVNRNTTWATQTTRGYTNPNSTSLKRSGNVNNIAIDPITGAIIGQTTDPLTCPQPIITINEALPTNMGSSTVIENGMPPSIEPTPASETFPPIIADTPTEPIVIQDGGILICSVQENPCTKETKTTRSQQLCNPTTDSDVPGTIQELCWNDGTQTWYPRSRYIMTNSTNKWPTNAVLTSAVILYPPTIISIISNNNIVTLTWTQTENCLPVSIFYIFQNNILVQNVPGIIFTTDIVVDNCNTYSYFIVASTNGSTILSEPSNTVSIDIQYLEPPTNLDYAVIASGTVQLTWTPTCNSIGYNIYNEDGILQGSTSALSFFISELTVCSNYSYYIASLDSYGNESAPSNTLSFQLLWPGQPDSLNIQEEITVTNSLANVTLNWNLPIDNVCTNSILTYNVYFNGELVASNVLELTYTFIGVNFYEDNAYGVQSSATITGIMQTSSISNIHFLVLPFVVEGSPIITNPQTSETIVQYTNANTDTNSIRFLIQPTHFGYIIVGGGGGGGAGAGSTSGGNSGGGGGGGGGQVISDIFSPAINTNYNIIVGNGGSGCYLYNDNQPETNAGGQSPNYSWGNGQNSSFDNYIAFGGYSGQGAVYTDGTSNYTRNVAPLGGSVGGGKGCFSNLGTGYKFAMAGTNGTTFTVYGIEYAFGGGGGGGSGYNFSQIIGGIGGGGAGGCGGDPPFIQCVSGQSNTGGGGGGGGCFASNTAYAYSTSDTTSTRNGGSGTVVLYFDYL